MSHETTALLKYLRVAVEKLLYDSTIRKNKSLLANCVRHRLMKTRESQHEKWFHLQIKNVPENNMVQTRTGGKCSDSR